MLIMKKITPLTIFLMLTFLFASVMQAKEQDAVKQKLSTSIRLSIVKSSEEPHTAKEHEYILKMENTTNQQLNVKIIASNGNCSAVSKFSNIDLVQSVFRTQEQVATANNTVEMLIAPNAEVEFFVKITNKSALLNKRNCTEVKAMDITGKNILSNKIEIETFIPDPKDFR